jgi:DNA-binding winged helix-turn-helix (wHTH) protein
MIDCEPAALGQHAVALLRALIEKSGALVSKDALIEAAWPSQVIEDSNLPVQIAARRRALGRAPGGDRWIETVPRRGYRFVGPVVAKGGNSITAAPPQIDTLPDAAPILHGKSKRRQPRRSLANWSAWGRAPAAWVLRTCRASRISACVISAYLTTRTARGSRSSTNSVGQPGLHAMNPSAAKLQNRTRMWRCSPISCRCRPQRAIRRQISACRGIR